MIEVVSVKSMPNCVTVRNTRTITSTRLFRNSALNVNSKDVRNVEVKMILVWFASVNRPAKVPGTTDPIAIPMPFNAYKRLKLWTDIWKKFWKTKDEAEI